MSTEEHYTLIFRTQTGFEGVSFCVTGFTHITPDIIKSMASSDILVDFGCVNSTQIARQNY